MVETSTPTVDELTAKQTRLGGDVDEATSALAVAKSTFADAAVADPTAVESLLELSKAVQAAEVTVIKAKGIATKCAADIAGIRFDESMVDVAAAGDGVVTALRADCEAYFSDNAGMVEDYAIDTLTITAKREPSGNVTVSHKATGENMPKRPSSKRGEPSGERGPRGTRSVKLEANGVEPSRAGEELACRAFVSLCGDKASPAAQADLAGAWDGSPVSYTNEAKRLAAKTGDTFQ